MAGKSRDPNKVRKAPVRKPVFLAVEVMDVDGKAMKISKEQINIIAVTKDAGSLLEMLEGGEHPSAVFKKVSV